MEREIQACADALVRLGRGRNGERLDDEFDEYDEYAHASAAAAQTLMTVDAAPLAEAIKRLAVADAACVADAIRILARVTPVAAAMGAPDFRRPLPLTLRQRPGQEKATPVFDTARARNGRSSPGPVTI